MSDGLEILAAMREDGIGMSAVALSSFIQIAKSDKNKESVETAYSVYRNAAASIKTQRVVTMMISCLGRAGTKSKPSRPNPTPTPIIPEP